MKPHQPTSAGFTLLELVTVLLLLAILAVTVSSRWTGTADLQVQQERDQLLALLRRLQIQTMQDSAGLLSRCPTLQLSASQAALTPAGPCAASYQIAADANDTNQLLFASTTRISTSFGALPQLIRFNALGETTAFCQTSQCQITLTGGGLTASICLHASGYLQPC